MIVAGTGISEMPLSTFGTTNHKQNVLDDFP